jgi:hypothetical protein
MAIPGAGDRLTPNDPPEQEIVVAELAEPVAGLPHADEPFGVPRRFGIGTIMIITAAFGVLLSSLQALGAPPGVVWFVVIFVSLIGVGQMLLFGARQPRRASIIRGAVCLPLMTLTTLSLNGPRGPNREAPCAFCAAVIFGGGFGYLAGGVVAGVFLVMDAIEHALGRARPRNTFTPKSPAPPSRERRSTDDSGLGT